MKITCKEGCKLRKFSINNVKRNEHITTGYKMRAHHSHTHTKYDFTRTTNINLTQRTSSSNWTEEMKSEWIPHSAPRTPLTRHFVNKNKRKFSFKSEAVLPTTISLNVRRSVRFAKYWRKETEHIPTAGMIYLWNQGFFLLF